MWSVFVKSGRFLLLLTNNATEEVLFNHDCLCR
jgi:hypothetical protein